MIVHTCDRCGESKEYPAAGGSKEDPHGELACPRGALCFECEDVQDKLTVALREYTAQWFENFLKGVTTPPTHLRLDELLQKRLSNNDSS